MTLTQVKTALRPEAKFMHHAQLTDVFHGSMVTVPSDDVCQSFGRQTNIVIHVFYDHRETVFR